MTRRYSHEFIPTSRFAKRVLCASALLAGAAVFAAGCSSGTGDGSTTSDEALAGTGPLSANEILGATTCGATQPASYTGATTYLAYSFPGTKGESVNIWVRGSAGADAEAWLLRSDFSELASNDNASTGIKDSNILSILPKTGTYYVAFKEKKGAASTFNVSLSCTGSTDGGVADAGKGDAGKGTDSGAVDSGGGGDAGPQCPQKCATGQSCVSGVCEYLSCTGLQVPGDYATIAGALAVIPSGGTICLAAQNYPENVSVSSTGTVVIQGISSGMTSIASLTASAGTLTFAGVRTDSMTLNGVSGSVTAAGVVGALTIENSGSMTVTDSTIGALTLGGSTATVTSSSMGPVAIVNSNATITSSTLGSSTVDVTDGSTRSVALNGVEILGLGLSSASDNGTLSFALDNSYVTAGANGFGLLMASAGSLSGSIALLNDTFVGPGSTLGTGISLTGPAAGTGALSLQYFNDIVTNFDLGVSLQGTFSATSFGNNALYGLTTRYGGSAVGGPGYVLTNPLLAATNPPGLLTGSPCLGAADSTHATSTDFFGNPRPSGHADIGAVQSSPNCASGTCKCSSGDSLCSSVCVNESTDSNNCGGCGVACGAGTACVGGACEAFATCTKTVTSMESATNLFNESVSVTYSMVGGGGGGANNATGGPGANGATASGTFSLPAGATLAAFVGGGGGYGEPCGAGGGGGGGAGGFGGGGGGNGTSGYGAGGGGGSSSVLVDGLTVAFAAGGTGGLSSTNGVGGGGGSSVGGAGGAGGVSSGAAGGANVGGNGGQGGFGGNGATGGNGQAVGGNGGTNGANGSNGAGSGGGGACGGGGGGGYGGGGGSPASDSLTSTGANNWAGATSLPAAAGAGGSVTGPTGGNAGLIILTYASPTGVCLL